MTNQQSSLRFDHREIAVIFSLFVFVSLLMFTVGILVGKGIAQARYEGTLAADRRLNTIGNQMETLAQNETKPSGNSVSMGEAPMAQKTIPVSEPIKPAENLAATAEMPEEKPLVLIPQKPRDIATTGSSLYEPGKNANAQQLLNNPKLKGLIEEDPAAKKKALLARSGGIPVGLPSGKFTVQVGSYPAQKDAVERVDALKKIGFSNAYFSAKEIGENREVWYRVWLGYFPDYGMADEAGRYLADKGEVKHYLVRKSDTAG